MNNHHFSLHFALSTITVKYDLKIRCMLQEWIQKNGVLTIVLRDSLHQPQYVEKLEKILRFMIKEKALTSDDLDKLWEAQVFPQCTQFCLYSGNSFLIMLDISIVCDSL